MLKLISPIGFGNISYQGQEYKTSKDGIVEVPAEAFESLKPFGFELFVEEERKTGKKSIEK